MHLWLREFCFLWLHWRLNYLLVEAILTQVPFLRASLFSVIVGLGENCHAKDALGIDLVKPSLPHFLCFFYSLLNLLVGPFCCNLYINGIRS